MRRKIGDITFRQLITALRSIKIPEPEIDPDRREQALHAALEEFRRETSRRESAFRTSKKRVSDILVFPRRSSAAVLITVVCLAVLFALSVPGRAYLVAIMQSARLHTEEQDATSLNPSDDNHQQLSWRMASDLPQPRAEHFMAVLSDGSVLVVGGRSTTSVDGVLRSAALLNPDDRSWEQIGGVLATRTRFGGVVALPDSSALIAGGTDRSGQQVLASTERYVPGSRSWLASGSLREARADAGLVSLVDGRVLIAGGRGLDGQLLASAELYDPSTRQWSATGAMPMPRAEHELVRLLDGRVLVLGGVTPASPAAPDVAVFDPGTGTWAPAGRLINGRAQAASLVLPTGAVLVTGGHNGQEGPAQLTYSAAELYDPPTGVSAPTGQSMTIGRSGHDIHGLIDGRVLVVGGEDSSAHATTEVFDPRTQLWEAGPSLDLVSRGFATVSLPNGNVLLSGGWDATGSALTASVILR